jgi:hypothetical protein
MVAVFPTTLGSGISTVGGVHVAASGKRWALGHCGGLWRLRRAIGRRRRENASKIWSNWKERNVWVLRIEEVLAVAIGESLDRPTSTSTNTHLKKLLFPFQIISGFRPI